MKRITHTFPNGYSGVVIDYGRGSEHGLFEITVLDVNGEPTYDTPVTDNRTDSLTDLGVRRRLQQIEKLPRVSDAEFRRSQRRVAQRIMGEAPR